MSYSHFPEDLPRSNSIKDNALLAVLIYLPAALFLFFLIIVTGYMGIPFSTLTLDPVEIDDDVIYAGLLSNIGNIFWILTAMTCLLTAAHIKTRQPENRSISFLVFSGLFSLALGLDDLLLLHSGFYQKVFNVRESTIFAIYIFMLVLFILCYYRFLMQTEYPLFFIAAAFLGISVFVDLLSRESLPWQYILEDGPKFLGIFGWFVFFTRTSYQAVQLEVKQ